MGIFFFPELKKNGTLLPLWCADYYSVCLLRGHKKESELGPVRCNCDVQLSEVACPLWPVLSQTSFPWPNWARLPQRFLSGSSPAQCVLLNRILFIPFPLINFPFGSSLRERGHVAGQGEGSSRLHSQKGGVSGREAGRALARVEHLGFQLQDKAQRMPAASPIP